MEDDYETYSGDVLERYFRLKLVESMEYLRLKENVIDVIEVKRNPEKFDKRLLEEKTAYFSSKEKQARKNKIVLSSLSMDDM